MTTDRRLTLLVEEIELPVNAYEGAKRRYEDLGRWFDRDECTLRDSDPHIFVQGSFALGTGIRPKAGEEYDLDLSCKLRKGIDRETYTQKQLKDMVGRELESYRAYRGIQDRLEPKHRCWRLKYQDDLAFHLDVVPAIPAETRRRAQIALLIERAGVDRFLAGEIAENASWITDDRAPGFARIHPNWLSSNPEGYVRWFVSRLEGPLTLLEKAQVDQVPLFRRKKPLQRVVQLLKAHRDVMFGDNPDPKPISIILTTIAGHAYVPNENLTDSFVRILRAFDTFRRSDSDEVLNPVNPEENFADRWALPECRHLRLKENFHRWIVKANADFQYLMTQSDPRELKKRADLTLKLRLDETMVAGALGLASTPAISTPSPRHVTIQAPPKPWASTPQ